VPDPILIKSAEFITSAANAGQYPADDMPELAFAGRSNVGKSTLINCLVQRKKLVRTSRTPGRTQLINFFKINDRVRFVDLPGYGYAKVALSIRASWGPMIANYLDTRKNLLGVIEILDLRHPPTPDDLNLWAWLKDKGIPSVAVLTKADKLPRSKWNPLRQGAAHALGILPQEALFFSAQTQQGRTELLEKISELIGEL
jgi:GTP-binding protein